MKILIINGSPKSNGTLSQILKSIRVNELKSNLDLEYVNVYDLNIDFCIGCMKCRTDGKCSTFLDDVEIVRNLIEKSDVLIVGSPTYFGNMSAKLKSLFERLVPTFMSESKRGLPIPKQKGKKAIIVTSCTTPFPFNILFKQSRGTVNSIKEVLKTAGYRIKTIEIAGTKNEYNKKKQIEKVKIMINSLVKKLSKN